MIINSPSSEGLLFFGVSSGFFNVSVKPIRGISQKTQKKTIAIAIKVIKRRVIIILIVVSILKFKL